MVLWCHATGFRSRQGVILQSVKLLSLPLNARSVYRCRRQPYASTIRPPSKPYLRVSRSAERTTGSQPTPTDSHLHVSHWHQTAPQTVQPPRPGRWFRTIERRSLALSKGWENPFMLIVHELKRRNVFRVAIAYLTGAWLLVEVAETLFPIYGLSASAVRLVVTLLAIGFPLALVFSWVFELTPEGLGEKMNSTPRQHRHSQRARNSIASSSRYWQWRSATSRLTSSCSNAIGLSSWHRRQPEPKRSRSSGSNRRRRFPTNLLPCCRLPT